MSNSFDEIEAGLNLLLADMRGTFSEEETAMVREYIDVGEYLLALETFVGIIVEGEMRVSRKMSDEVMRVGSLMNTDSPHVLRIKDVVGT